MEKCIIRCVDSGNIQRSPTFQAVFRWTASKMRLPEGLIFDSAGIDVDKIMANSTPTPKKLDIINIGVYERLFGEKDGKVAEDLISSWLGKPETEIPESIKGEVIRFYAANKTRIHSVQMGYRDAALKEAGIPERFIPGMRNPFRHEKDLRLILPVDGDSARKVANYYSSIGEQMPDIKLYAELIGTGQLLDELIGGMDLARKQLQYFLGTRYVAIERICKLLGI